MYICVLGELSLDIKMKHCAYIMSEGELFRLTRFPWLAQRHVYIGIYGSMRDRERGLVWVNITVVITR